MIKYAKESFINRIDDIICNQESGNSSKSFWQVMGRFMGKKGTSVIIPPLQKQDHTYAFTDYEKAEELNTYFASISTMDDARTELPFFASRCDTNFIALSHIHVSAAYRSRIYENVDTPRSEPYFAR